MDALEELRRNREARVNQIQKGFASYEIDIQKAQVGERRTFQGKEYVWIEFAPGKFGWRRPKDGQAAAPQPAPQPKQAASSQGIKAWKDLTKKEKDAAYTTTHDLLKEKLKNTNNESLSWRQGGYEIVKKLSKVYGEKIALKLVLDSASAFQGASQGFIFNTYIKLRVQGYSDENANKITRNTYKYVAGRDWIDG